MTAVTSRTQLPEPAVADFRYPGPLLRLPGVYRPQADTWLLAAAVAGARIPPGARVLDICTGTGALAVTAAHLGAAEVTAIDLSRRAVLSTWLNTRLTGLPIRPRRVSFVDLVDQPPFDVVLANPPYVPCASDQPPAGRKRAWDAGPDGRAVLDPLCRTVPELLAESGSLLLVHSELAGVDESLARLRAGGLHARVVARRRIGFGPVLRGRIGFLERNGFIGSGQRHENLVVIRADRS